MSINKSEILDNIKSLYNLKTDTQLAEKLGVKSQTISTWRNRNSIDIELIYSKCEFIDGNYLLSGKGEILRSKTKKININKILNYIQSNKEDLNNNVNWSNYIQNIKLKAQKELLLELSSTKSKN